MNVSHIGLALHNLIFKIAGEDRKRFVEIAFYWKKLVGPILAEKAFVHKLEQNVLFIAVNNNVWMQELILQKTYLKKKIFVHLKIELKDIVFFTTDDLASYKPKGF